MPQETILSGMRPSGKLHLGNYVGALENWVKLQKEYQCFYFVADWHVLTTELDTSTIKEDTLNMVMDWLSSGLDPEKSVLFVQSKIKEHAELHLLFSMLITTSRLERNPTLKEQVRDMDLESGLISYGHLGYPVLQSADILIYKPNYVPVGEDQLPHIEISREIARRFNNQYGVVFPEPEPMLTRFARLPGLDGKKMSKSLGNTIFMSDSSDEIKKKVRMAITDPQKIRKGDPGRPDICNVFAYHLVFNQQEIPEIRKNCESGALGCVDCKNNCANKISEYFAPMREKRSYYESNQNLVMDILSEGNKKAREVAGNTMEEVRKTMNME